MTLETQVERLNGGRWQVTGDRFHLSGQKVTVVIKNIMREKKR